MHEAHADEVTEQPDELHAHDGLDAGVAHLARHHEARDRDGRRDCPDMAPDRVSSGLRTCRLLSPGVFESRSLGIHATPLSHPPASRLFTQPKLEAHSQYCVARIAEIPM